MHNWLEYMVVTAAFPKNRIPLSVEQECLLLIAEAQVEFDIGVSGYVNAYYAKAIGLILHI